MMKIFNLSSLTGTCAVLAVFTLSLMADAEAVLS